MTGTILTPVTVWNDFKIDAVPQAEYENERTDGEITLSDIVIDGRKTQTGRVKIYGVIARNKALDRLPAVLILQNMTSGIEEDTVKDFARRGYCAVMIDLCGKSASRKKYTVYPEDIDYANFETSRNSLFEIKTDVTGTCWYEWGCAAKYALEYLRQLPFITHIGAYGIRRAASVLWQISTSEPDIKCNVFTLNTGWRAYRKYYKYGTNSEPDFNDEWYKYLAGVEPQAYAQYVKSPCLILTSTNSLYYECDRAYDTVSRIDSSLYKAMDFSPLAQDCVDYNAYRNMFLFFDNFLNVNKTYLPSEIEIFSEIIDKKIRVTVEVDSNNLDKLSLYTGEETVNPAIRSWNLKASPISADGKKYTFEYQPYNASGIAFFFAKAVYVNGFSISSKIIAKKFAPEEVLLQAKSNIVYSSRIHNAESCFTAAKIDNDSLVSYMITSSEPQTSVKKGPMGISGIYAKNGLLTYKINAAKDKPNDRAILLLDAYSPNDCALKIRLICNCDGDSPVVFSAAAAITGGEVWHNLQFDISKFKTAEGMLLRSFEKVNALVFECNGEYLINNILWI